MALTGIAWTASSAIAAVRLSRTIRFGKKIFLEAGQHDVGTLLPGFTFNPWMGCQKISRACKRCYAQVLVEGRMGYGNPDSVDPRKRLKLWGTVDSSARSRTSPENWRRPKKWNDLAKSLGTPLKVFTGSLCDVGEDDPRVRGWRLDLFELMEATPWLIWMTLTKRPGHLAAEWPAAWRRNPPRNVWPGSTVEDQPAAEERINDLLSIPAPHRWLSCEPLVGRLDIRRWLVPEMKVTDQSLDAPDGAVVDGMERVADRWYRRDRISLVIGGGETGPGHDEMDLAWLYGLHAQCVDPDSVPERVGRFAKTAFFCKQDSGHRDGLRGRIREDVWRTKQAPEIASW